jgi:hypothetical protein
MCQEEKTPLVASSHKMTSFRADSTMSNASYASDATPVPVDIRFVDEFEKQQQQVPRRLNVVSTTFAGLALAAGMLGFALFLPFVPVIPGGAETFKFAFWTYDPALSHFDNSAWTYVTDYILAAIMAALVVSTMICSQKGHTDRLCNRSASLLLLYMVSVTAGGLCHSHYLTLESRNTLGFRFLWTFCVGTVSLASTSMGMCGTEMFRKYQAERRCSPFFDRNVPHIPELFWWVYGICVAAFTAWGGMSFQRPACDIFIAGITQTPPTFYVMVVFLFLDSPKVELKWRILGMVGFILNAPLLPVYPLLVQYTDLSLSSVNTLLHCWLCAAWSLQGLSMRHVIRSLNANEKTP